TVRVGQSATPSAVGQVGLDGLAPRQDAEPLQRVSGGGEPVGATGVEQRAEHVFGVDGVVVGPLGLGDRGVHDLARGAREPLEHQYLPYFLCTACRLTPSSVAISCQDQPCTRALRTWTASSCSRRRRRAATDRRPTRGSLSPARAARLV